MTSTPRSRRALLAGLVGGIGAWAAAGIGRAAPAQAAAGDPLLMARANIGGPYPTRLKHNTDTLGFQVEQNGDGSAIYGIAGAGIGVIGSSDEASGVYGFSVDNVGVHGASTNSYAGYFAGSVYTSRYVDVQKSTTPAAPEINQARLFVRDDGTGKSQLCVVFTTGAVQVIATQP
jgi:hypothetical protein